jgi:hypothetical protein
VRDAEQHRPQLLVGLVRWLAIERRASPSRSISRAPRTRLSGISPRAMPSICRTRRDTGAATQRLISAATRTTTSEQAAEARAAGAAGIRTAAGRRRCRSSG